MLPFFLPFLTVRGRSFGNNVKLLRMDDQTGRELKLHVLDMWSCERQRAISAPGPSVAAPPAAQPQPQTHGEPDPEQSLVSSMLEPAPEPASQFTHPGSVERDGLSMADHLYPLQAVCQATLLDEQSLPLPAATLIDEPTLPMPTVPLPLPASSQQCVMIEDSQVESPYDDTQLDTQEPHGLFLLL